MDSVQNNGTGISIQGEEINNLKFADDIDMLDEDWDLLVKNIQTLDTEGRRAGLEINVEMTKSLIFGSTDSPDEIKIPNKVIENVMSLYIWAA